MKVQDHTGGEDKTVDLFLSSSQAISIPAIPWSFSIDGVKSEKKTFKLVATTAWQHVAKIYVGYASEFIFHIDETGYAQMGGPTDLVVPLENKTKPVNVYINGVWKKAIPYVYTNGAWTPAVAMVFSNSAWTEVV